MSGDSKRYQMRQKTRDGQIILVELTEGEIVHLLVENKAQIASRLALVECQTCGHRFPVNTQDLAIVRECKRGYGCKEKA